MPKEALAEKVITTNPVGACGGDMSAEVEKPDDSMDLLAGIGAEDLSLLGDAPDFSIQTDDFSSVSEPHWLFDTQALYDRIKALSVVVKDKMELVSRCVWVKAEGGCVIFRVNTGEAYVEVKTNLANTTNTLDKDYVMDFKVLFSVIRNSGAKFLIRDKAGAPSVTVLGGEVELENFNLDRTLFQNPELDATEGLQKYEGGLFSRFLSRSHASMALAVRPEDRRLRVEDGVSLSNFMSSLFIQRDVEIRSLSLRASDVVFLSRILEAVPEFQFREGHKEYIFISSWSKLSIPKIDTSDIASVREVVEKIEKKFSFSVSPIHLYKVVTLLKTMVGNSGIAKVKVEEGKLILLATTKTSKTLRFPIATAAGPADFQVSCPVASLASTAMMFKKDPVVEVSVDAANKLIFVGDGLEVIFGSAI